MKFSKTIFQAWKVMENSQGHGKSWKMMTMFCNTEIHVNTCTSLVVLSYDEQQEIYFYSSKLS